jgi:hypothetical protein
MNTRLRASLNPIRHILGNRLENWLRAFRRRSACGNASAAWRSELERTAADLEEQSQGAERDFLEIGGKLMEFRSAALRISRNMVELTESVSGGPGQDVPNTLARLLGYVHDMDARFERNVRDLAGVRSSAAHVLAAFQRRGATAQAFRTLCTLTRIETARLGGAAGGFGDLAEAVAPLSEQLRSSAENVSGVAERLGGSAQSSLESAEGLRGRQVREMRDLITGVAEALNSFEEKRLKASDASARQGARYRAVCEAIDGTVQSIQFHDITRQQVEHIASALRELGGAPEARMRPVLRLQGSQLANASQTFGAAMDRMERDMQAIAASARAMAEAGERLMGGEGGERDNFFLRMEERFTAILKIAAQCGSAEEEVAARAAGLEANVEEMGESVSEMRGIELQIRRIATNAAISAAHLGSAGDALNVIAEAMHALASESSNETEAAAEALAAMGQAAGKVFGGGGGSGAMLTELRDRTLELHSSSEASFRRVSESATLGAQLSAEIQAMLGGFAAGRRFDAAMQEARAQLERIEAEVGSAGEAGAQEEIAGFAARYTMEREREVHAGIARGPAAPPGAALADPEPDAVPAEPAMALAGAAEPAGDDLGDNVELF